ncbi:glycosyltransferase family 4 protein [Tianweitania populi]|uniref:Glycosyl transferase family 1 n=1 Tax=Tianweitania populi TaxID=1607949 RepID=A0A8J3DNA5_9HYPH|nr:glycosyltransferase family 4 protein [Tianweitania populi]GHD08739.1 glycosyl transferase family 1 [Tianweitania populi]
MPPSLSDTIVVISDFRDGWPPEPIGGSEEPARERWLDGRRGPPPGESATPSQRDALSVTGGYLERLPLAAVKSGLAGRVEIWHHWRPSSPPPYAEDHQLLARRAFHLDGEDAPFRSTDMLGFIAAYGAPKILCVWGLGVDEHILEACRDSFKIYNSIDAPAFRIPDEVGRHFDLVLTGAEWQSEEVRARLPDMECLVLPIGPDFADPQTFRPLATEKPHDVIYVAAAQGYKRHDILFDALEQRPGTRALCVFGYGEMADDLRHQAAQRGLDVTFVGPPGVPFEEVNRLMNQARIGVVCGIDDGAPAILTEYMLAGLPVLANAGLRCGLQYIIPETGMTADPDRFHEGIDALLARANTMNPRETVLANWTWNHSIQHLAKRMNARNNQKPAGLL